MRTSSAFLIGYQVGLFGILGLVMVAMEISDQVAEESPVQQALEQERAEGCPNVSGLCDLEEDTTAFLAALQDYGIWIWLIAMGPAAIISLMRGLAYVSELAAVGLVVAYRLVRRRPVFP